MPAQTPVRIAGLARTAGEALTLARTTTPDLLIADCRDDPAAMVDLAASVLARVGMRPVLFLACNRRRFCDRTCLPPPGSCRCPVGRISFTLTLDQLLLFDTGVLLDGLDPGSPSTAHAGARARAAGRNQAAAAGYPSRLAPSHHPKSREKDQRDMTCSRLIVCASHLGWDLVFQRPQHLMTRAARDSAVLYLEEPREEDRTDPVLARRIDPSGVVIATPLLPRGTRFRTQMVRTVLDEAIAGFGADELVLWIYTPMALDYVGHLAADARVYDCMDELSAFSNPPAGLIERERQLLRQADLVFVGGRSLFEAKCGSNPATYLYPSSVDAAHFGSAADGLPDPADQAALGRPRIGFFGVIDERMDLSLVEVAARACPEVSFVFLGPVVKIDPASLPQGVNLHWLGRKTYGELPAYLAHWDAGWMPFALNDATRFISPTKTPEFLASGLPVVSTAVPDVVRDYGLTGMVAIADETSIAAALRQSLGPQDPIWRRKVSAQLARTSWERTWAEMDGHVRRVGGARLLASKGI